MTTMHYVIIIWIAIGLGLTSCTSQEAKPVSEPELTEVMLPSGLRISCKNVITNHVSIHLYGCNMRWENIYCKEGVCVENKQNGEAK